MRPFVIAFVFSMCCASAALANGAIGERKTGGLVFKQSDTVSILREDLFVSLNKITVGYRYKSADDKTQKVTIVFPMPSVDVDDGPGSIVEILPEGSPPENYMAFTASIDGKPVEVKPFARAFFGDTDLTAKLEAHGIPLHMMVDNKSEILAKLPQPLLDELYALGAIIKDDYQPPSYFPVWQYQVAFEWEQEFKAGETRVDISYVPLAGYPSDIGDSYETGERAKAACVDDTLLKTIAKRKAGGGYYEVATVGYVLTTAKYWKGPIGEFNLTVEKPNADDLAAFCPLEAKKVSPTRFEWQAKDFAPDKDLSAVFYTFQPSPQ
jgi:hypothetical protein